MKRTTILREAYQQYLDGKRTLESVLDLSDHMGEFLRAAVPADVARASGSPLHEAYQRCLDGELPLDDVLALADRVLAPAGGNGE